MIKVEDNRACYSSQCRLDKRGGDSRYIVDSQWFYVTYVFCVYGSGNLTGAAELGYFLVK